MWNKAKIMRQAERALKRTEAYREKSSDGIAPEDNFQLGYVLVKDGKSAPDTAIAYAHYEDEIISFNPVESGGDTKAILDWAFSFDGDLFMYLEQGYELAGASALTHSLVWGDRHRGSLADRECGRSTLLVMVWLWLPCGMVRLLCQLVRQ